jgi:hypothetical protein
MAGRRMHAGAILQKAASRPRAGALLWPRLFRCLTGKPVPFRGPLNPKRLPLKIVGYISQAAARLGFSEQVG